MSYTYDPESVPSDDLYASTPLYGRYKAKDGDSLIQHLTPLEIYTKCTLENEMVPEFIEGRHIYAIGGVIVKGRHELNSAVQSHAFGDANEVDAIALVREHFPWIPVPEVYFQGRVVPY